MSQPFAPERPPHHQNPYLPAIGRVLEVLYAQFDGTPLTISLRALAAAACCAPGAIPDIIRRLEHDGHIRRLPDARGYRIVVLTDQGADRLPNADQQFDRPCSAEMQSNAALAPDTRPVTGAPNGDQNPDRRLHCMEEHVLNMQQQPAARTRELPLDQDMPPIVPDAAFPIPWAAIRAANPGYTHTDFFRDLAYAQARPEVRDPLRLTVKARLRGEPVVSKEAIHARTIERPRSAAATDQRRVARPDTSSGGEKAIGRAASRRHQPATAVAQATVLTRDALATYPRLHLELQSLPGQRRAAGDPCSGDS